MGAQEGFPSTVHVYVYACIYDLYDLYVCMCICMRLCMICLHLYVYACMYVCAYVWVIMIFTYDLYV